MFKTIVTTTLAMVLTTQALARADAAAEYDRAVAAYQDGNYPEALKLLESPARDGHAEAQYVLGLMYHRGRGTNPDPTKAVEWYGKAAEQNHAAAMCNLGMILSEGFAFEGNAVKPDKAKAKDLLRRASYLENAPAWTAYGAVMINEGDGGKDFVEGVAFMRMAADAGDEVAVNNVKGLKVTPEQSAAADAKRKEIETNIQKIRELRAAEAKEKSGGAAKKNPLDN